MTYQPGNICHVEIPAPDIPRLKAFYGAVFGWKFTPLHKGFEYFDAGNIAGGFVADAQPSETGSVLTILVTDVATKLTEVVGAGGRVLLPPADVPGGNGRYAYFADPCGNKVGIWMRTE